MAAPGTKGMVINDEAGQMVLYLSLVTVSAVIVLGFFGCLLGGLFELWIRFVNAMAWLWD